MAITKNAPDYYIHDTALTFTPNYQDRDIVYVSIVSNAAIAVLKPGIPELGYAADAGYQRWSLTGYTTKLGTTGAYNIYARLSRAEKKAMIIFSVNDYNVDGSVAGGEASAEYWYIKIGDITASEGGVDRQLNYDSGILGTNRGMAESNTVLEKMFKWNSTDGTFTMQAYLTNLLLKAGAVIKWGERQLKGIVGMPTDYAHSQQLAESEDTLVTPKFVKAYSDLNYVSKKQDDTIEGNIAFKQDVNIDGAAKVGSLEVGADSTVGGSQTIGGNQTVQGGITISNNDKNDGVALKIGDYIEQGDIIQGAQVTKEGIASFAKVKTPSMQVYELTLNRKTAVQGEYVFSDGETIEEVVKRDDDTYQLRVREPYEGYITTFKVDDILYSNINMLDSSAKTGKCWMFVTEVNGSTITAKMYPAERCPSGENIAPIPHMTITRHGNRTDKTRQDLFVISSETSSLTMLRGVDAPIVSSEGLYGVVLGKLPSTLLDYIKRGGYEYVNGEDPYVYARGVIVQDLIMLDYQGKPIRQEVYRGHWSAEVATTNPYQSSATAYDTVTHNGSLWQCMVGGTKAEPKEGIADWLIKVAKGDDATATIYELVPSVNVIYYRVTDKSISVRSINVKVGEHTSHGYTEIVEQYMLDGMGLKVYYSIDGKGERKALNISPISAYLLEDGTAVISTEDGYGLSLEGEVIDINSIEDNITLYLTDTSTGEDKSIFIIPVIGAQVGNNILLNSALDEFEDEGESDMLKHWDMTSDMAILILSLKDLDGIYNAAEVCDGGIKQYVSLTDKRSYTFSVYVKPKPTCQIIYRTNTASDVVIASKQGTIKETTTDTYKAITFTPDVPSNEYTLVSMTIHATNYASQDTIELTAPRGGALYACPKLEEGSVATTYSKAVSELTGKAGERGRMLYPAGDYADDVTYKIENNSAPFVREGETYYVLEWEEGEVSGIKPSEDYAKNGGHWKPFTYMNYLFAEFLMAKWAHFGSNNGAVFYDKYLFSQQGNVLDANGYLSAEDASYGGYKDKMFDEKGNLTNKEFIPNVSINFATGEVDTSRLNERFYDIDSDKGLIKMGSKVLNLAITPTTSYAYDSKFGVTAPFVVLPQGKLSSGAHVSIVARQDGNYLQSQAYDRTYCLSTFALISADDVVGSYINTGGRLAENWIIWQGYRAKFVMLAPCYTLNLRLEIVGNGDMYLWHVENSADFVDLKAALFADINLTQTSVGAITQTNDFTKEKYVDADHSSNWSNGFDDKLPYCPIIVASRMFSSYTGNEAYLGASYPSIILSTNANGMFNGRYYRLANQNDGGDVGFEY